MNKLKTSKSIKKRFSITAKGKVLRRQASKSHLLYKKTSKRKQKLSQVVNLSKVDLSSFKQTLMLFM